MNDTLHAILATHFAHCALISNIAHHEVDVIECISVAAFERVEHHHITPQLGEQAGSVRADVASTASDENGHTANAFLAVDFACRDREPFQVV